MHEPGRCPSVAYLHCFGHTFNLAVKAGLAVTRISHVQAKCTRVVSFFRKSSKAKYVVIENNHKTNRLLNTVYQIMYNLVPLVLRPAGNHQYHRSHR